MLHAKDVQKKLWKHSSKTTTTMIHTLTWLCLKRFQNSTTTSMAQEVQEKEKNHVALIITGSSIGKLFNNCLKKIVKWILTGQIMQLLLLYPLNSLSVISVLSAVFPQIILALRVALVFAASDAFLLIKIPAALSSLTKRRIINSSIVHTTWRWRVGGFWSQQTGKSFTFSL